jgi:hypothetical protein
VDDTTSAHNMRKLLELPESPEFESRVRRYRHFRDSTQRTRSGKLPPDVNKDTAGPSYEGRPIRFTGQWGGSIPDVRSSGESTPILSPRPLGNKPIAILSSKVIPSSSTVATQPESPRVSASVVNSPSVTPPPNVSTAPVGHAQPRSIAETLEPRRGPDTSTTTVNTGSEEIDTTRPSVPSSGADCSGSTSSAAMTTDGEGGSATPENETSGAHALVAITRRTSITITAPEIVVAAPEIDPPQLTMTTASRGPSSVSTSSNTTTATAETRDDHGRAAEADASTSTTASPAIVTTTWSKRKPLSPGGTILHALKTQTLPAPKANEALFLPADAECTWYTGFLQLWESFNKDATKYWKSAHLRDAFDHIKSYPMVPPPSVGVTNDHGSKLLHLYFEREALGVIQEVYNMLTNTPTMRDDKQPNKLWLGNANDEDLGNTDFEQKPSYTIKASRNAKDEAIRALGQVEYLGGKKGALTWAVSEQYKNTWGSLRCVLGKPNNGALNIFRQMDH